MNDNTKGCVRYINEGEYYITTYDEIGDEYTVVWNDDCWELKNLVGNKSAREDSIVFEGNLADCNNFIADQFED